MLQILGKFYTEKSTQSHISSHAPAYTTVRWYERVSIVNIQNVLPGLNVDPKPIVDGHLKLAEQHGLIPARELEHQKAIFQVKGHEGLIHVDVKYQASREKGFGFQLDGDVLSIGQSMGQEAVSGECGLFNPQLGSAQGTFRVKWTHTLIEKCQFY